MMQHSSLIKEELSLCMLLPHAARQLGQLELQLRASSGGLLVGGLKVSMYEVLMNQYLGDLENVMLKV